MTRSHGHKLSAHVLAAGFLASTFFLPETQSVRAQASPEASPVQAGDQYTPVVASVFSTPRWFTGSDGQVHLVYELGVLNAFPVDITLAEVEILDGGSGLAISS